MKECYIYQPKDIMKAQLSGITYTKWQKLNNIRVKNYNLVYSCQVEDDTSLDDIFYKFQHGIHDLVPEDYESASLSGGDIIAIKDVEEDNIVAHHIDFIGFTIIPNFFLPS